MREEFSGTRAKGVAVGPFAPFLRLTFNPLIGIKWMNLFLLSFERIMI